MTARIHPAASALAALPPSHLDAAARVLEALRTLTPTEAGALCDLAANVLPGLAAKVGLRPGDVVPAGTPNDWTGGMGRDETAAMLWRLLGKRGHRL